MKTLVSLLFVLLLGGLTVADAMLIEGWPPTPKVVAQPDNSPTGVVKQGAKDPLAIVAAAKLTAVEQSQTTLLEQVVANKENIQQFNVLDGNTPIGSIAWHDGVTVGDEYKEMKDSLFTSFSDSVIGLKDTTMREAGKVTVYKIEFKDEKIAPGTTVLMRIQQRFYEIHIEDGFELDMKGVIEELSR